MLARMDSQVEDHMPATVDDEDRRNMWVWEQRDEWLRANGWIEDDPDVEFLDDEDCE
jgi:hypothetical protein